MYSAIFGLGLLLAPLGTACAEEAAAVAAPPVVAEAAPPPSSTVVFVYQRVGDDSLPQGNISLDQFKEHIKELKTGGYTVLPLPKIIDALKAGETLPDRTVGLTFEGAYITTMSAVTPLLDDAGLPFTVFFSSDAADGGSPAHMNWQQLKDLKKDKLVTFGILPSAYAHMVGRTKDQNAALINKAISHYREQFGEDPQFFAYPYGEFSAEVKKQLGDYAFKAAFGQQSGVIHPKSDFLSLPRFTMTDNYGDLDRFQLTANALPLPVTDVIPEDTVIKDNPPMIGFTVAPEIKDIGKLSCFVSGAGKADLTRPGGGRVEIRLKDKIDDRRTRINCTLPDDTIVPGEAQRWRWFGMLLIAPEFDDDTSPPQQEEGEDGSGDE